MNRSTKPSATHNLIAQGSGRALKLEHLPSGKVLAYCNAPAPASRRCSPQCACAKPAGHTTLFHRAKCGLTWKSKKLDVQQTLEAAAPLIGLKKKKVGKKSFRWVETNE